MSKLHFDEPNTPEEERAIEILKNAKLETDEDYKNLALLIDQTIADEFLAGEDE